MHKCAACNSSQPGRSWWDSKNGQAFVCTPCGLLGHAKETADAIRLKVEGSPAAAPVREEPRSSVTRTKSDTQGPSDPAAALRAVTQAAEQLAVAMRESPPVPESMMGPWKELWAKIWAMAGVPAPPLPAAVAGGKGGPIPARSFDPMKGLEMAEPPETDEPPTTGRKRFDPLAGLEKAAEADTVVRVPRFSVGV